AYRYLAFAKNPQDRPLIEALLESELQLMNWFGGYDPSGRPTGAPFVALRSDERVLAGQLLDEWDGIKRDPSDDSDPGLIYFAQKAPRFGGVGGVLRLPFAMPANSGSVFICLIPAKLSGNDWQTDEHVLRLF